MWNEAELNKQIKKIPIDNMLKFYIDLQTLVLKAQGDDYENYNLT